MILKDFPLKYRKIQKKKKEKKSFFFFEVLTWRDQRKAVYKSGSVPTPPIDLQDYLEYSQDIWGSFSTKLELCENGSEISFDPPPTPKRPPWTQIWFIGAKNGSNFINEISYFYHFRSK